MEQKTRRVFFSLGSGSVHGKAASGPKGLEAQQQEAGVVATESGQKILQKGTVSHGDNNKQRFSANFGRKEAWESVEQPTIRTQGRQSRR